MKKPRHIGIKIRLLRQARKLIESRSNFGLCSAIQTARSNDYQNCTVIKASSELLAYIQEVLESEAYLGSWQLSKGFYGRNNEQQRLDRLAWIDWMIADYQKWGMK